MKPIIVQGNHKYNPGHLTGTMRKVVTAVTPKAEALPPARIFEIPESEMPVLLDTSTRFPDGQASRRERRAREREQKKNNR